MRIDNITINFPAAPALSSALISALLAKGEPYPAGTHADACTPPAIGAKWQEQGGIYAGLARGVNGQPDQHLVLASAEPDGKLAWQAALDWASGLEHEGFTDWAVPTRFESALLYANLQESFDTSPWYWTSTQHSDVAQCAWVQLFDNGTQGNGVKGYEGRVRAVRRFNA